MRTTQARAMVVTCAAVGCLVVLGDHRPAAPAAAPDDPTALVVAVATWAAWALALYLLLGVGCTAARHIRGSRPPGEVATRLPAAAVVRRIVDVLVGATATAAVVALCPAAASADTGPGARSPAATPVVGAPLDWPGLGTTHAGAKRPAPASAQVPVRPGDSLWSITARRLGPDATAAQVAAEWPRVYAANRAAIGPDPDLIHPGQRLTLPPTTGGPQ